MYFDRRLWAFTRGVRLRIAAAIGLGLLQVAAGIARLALLGWLLARVFGGASLADLAIPAVLTAAAIVARGVLEYTRTTMAHWTAALVQARLRETIYDHLVALGPAHVAGTRTGSVIVSMVEGVQRGARIRTSDTRAGGRRRSACRTAPRPDYRNGTPDTSPATSRTADSTVPRRRAAWAA